MASHASKIDGRCVQVVKPSQQRKCPSIGLGPGQLSRCRRDITNAESNNDKTILRIYQRELPCQVSPQFA